MNTKQAATNDPMVSMGLRLPQSLKEALEMEAQKDGRTLSNYVVRALQAHLADKQQVRAD